MTIYLCDWPDRASLLIDDANEASARAVALEVAEVEPSAVRALPPRVFVAEVVAEDGEDGEDVLVVEVLAHVEKALLTLLDDPPDEPRSPVLRVVPSLCTAEAYDPEDRVVTCSKEPGHKGDHGRGSLTWDGKA